MLFILFIFTATIKGFVKDKTTGEPIEIVYVYLENTNYWAITNRDGYYVITNIPKGEYKIVFSIIGYKVLEKKVNIIQEVNTFNVELIPSAIKIEEIKVKSKRREFEQEIKTSSVKLRTIDIKSTPSFLESDLLKIVQTFPGVVMRTDFSNALYVRGSNCDENLILLDGAPVYNPFHFAGLFSVFDVDAISGAELFTGGFSAEYGNRIASVLDVYTREGNSKNYSASSSISFLSAKLLLEGPIPKGSFFISGRRTYFDKVLPIIINYEFPYYFYDLYFKANYNLSENTKMFFSSFNNNDKLDLNIWGNRIFLDWGNTTSSFVIRKIFSPTLFTKTYLTYSKFDYSSDMIGPIKNDCFLQEYGIKHDVNFIKEQEIKTGIDFKYTNYKYDADMLGGVNYDAFSYPIYTAFYIQKKSKMLNDKIIIEPGLRLTIYRAYNRAIFKMDTLKEIKTDIVNEPRLRLKYFITKNDAINVAFGKYYQFATAIIEEQNPVHFIYPWIPTYGKYSPKSAIHYILGIDKWISDYWSCSLEFYYKNMPYLLDFNSQVDIKHPFYTLFLEGSGKSYGIDLLVKKDIGNITGWLSYSFSKAKVNFNNKEYYPLYDRSHTLNIISKISLIKGYDFLFRFNFATGTPYTSPKGRIRRFYWDPVHNKPRYYWIRVPGDKNNMRYPNYHRLDIGISKATKKWGINFDFNLQIINIYNKKNVFIYLYDFDYEPPPKRAFYMFPIIPSIEINAKI